MHFAVSVLALAGCASAQYSLQHNYTSENWFDSFQAVADNPDPTGGFVNYLSQSQAEADGLYKTIGNQIFIGVDNTTTLSSTSSGRKSVKIQSSETFQHAIIIADIAHVPATACGLWPAFWMLGSGTWPQNGEIDIYEGINNSTSNQITIHSKPGCNITVAEYGQKGKAGSHTDCGYGGGYDGCTVFANTPKSYGSGFNAAGGGVYALHWNDNEIKVWLWNSGSVPSTISDNGPINPNLWGTPQASWAVSEGFDEYFNDMTLLFNTDFCGTWAGAQWNASPVCHTKADTCNAYVAENPGAFDEAYWLVNSVRVYNG